MQAEQLDAIYTMLAEAIGRVGEEKAPLMLATLSLDLIAHHVEFAAAAEAIARAERLAQDTVTPAKAGAQFFRTGP